MGDVIILPSAFGEGCPNVLLEGMLYNLFPISTDIGDARLIIEDIGLIVDTPAVCDIQKALAKVASMNRKQIRKTAENGLMKIKNKFNLNTMKRKYNQIYEGLK